MSSTKTSDAETLLYASQPRRVANSVSRIAGEAVSQIDTVMPDAVVGRRGMVRLYVRAYRDLTNRILGAVQTARPDIVILDEDRGVTLAIEVKARSQEKVPRGGGWLRAALEQEAMSAPFTDWVGTFGAGQGAAIALVDVLRSLLPSAQPLPHPQRRRPPTWSVDDRGAIRFYRAVVDELEREQTPLDHLAAVMGLSQTELARLFGVRRQALDHWEDHNVPGERQAKLATLSAIADLLVRKLKRDRIPGVVRRPAAAYGNRSILDAIAAGDEELVLAELREAFDWSAAA